MLYEMIAGQRPFKSDYQQALVYDILYEDPKPLRELDRTLPDNVEHIVQKALVKKAADRYQQIEEMLADLDAAREGRPVSPGKKARTSRSLRKQIAWYVVVGLALIIAGETLYRVSVPSRQPALENITIGVLPFENQTEDVAIAERVPSMQRILASKLSGMKNLGIFDPSSLNGLLEHELGSAHPARGPKLNDVIRNAKIAYIVDGVILKAGGAYEIHSNIIDPSNWAIRYSAHAVAAGFGDLSRTVDTVSQQILSYFEMILHLNTAKELTPWLSHRTSNIEALIAFEKAYQMMYNAKGGWEKYLRRAIELDSTFITPRLWLIEMLVGRGNMREAEEHYKTLRRLESGSSPFEQAMINWTGAYMSKDQPAQERYLQMALEYSPDNNILLYNLGSIRSDLGKYSEGVEVLVPIVERRWNYSPAYYVLGECYDRLKLYGKARNVLEQSLSVMPVLRDSYGLLLTLMLREADSVKAAEYEGLYLQRSRETGHSLDQSYASLASMCAVEGFNNEAAKYYRSALALQPDVSWYHDSLGNMLYLQGNLAAASKEYLRAHTLDSTSVNAHRMLGKISESMGRMEDALSHYREYLKYDSTSREADEVRKSLARLTH